MAKKKQKMMVTMYIIEVRHRDNLNVYALQKFLTDHLTEDGEIDVDDEQLPIVSVKLKK